jgi:plasmid stabilization system protein ParE
VNDYVLGSDAVLDLEDVWEYIAADSVDAADRWIAKLFDAFETIAGMPGIGHSRTDLTAFPVRFWAVGAYLIVYRSDGQRVEIVAVTQGSRDIPSFLRRRLG